MRIHCKLLALEQRLKPAPLNRIISSELTANKLELWIKRDDLLHPIVSGNKWRKLKYIFNHALNLGAKRIISMGGPYSNHLHALAYAGRILGIETAALIRGEEPANLNSTLRDLQRWQMALRYISRGDYRQLRTYSNYDSFPDLKPGDYWLPEGGAVELALPGIAESATEIDIDFDDLVVACGTGTTLAGYVASLPKYHRILGVSVLKPAEHLRSNVRQLLIQQGATTDNWHILADYHCGGFAKKTPSLLGFIDRFSAKHNIPLEPVYTGKLMFAICDLIKNGYFSEGRRIIAVHSGGLQGNRTPEQN